MRDVDGMVRRCLVCVTCGVVLLALFGSLPAVAAETNTLNATANYDVLNGPYRSPDAVIAILSHNHLAYDPVLGAMISQVSESNILRTTWELQNFSTRLYPSRGNRAAAGYIHDRLASTPGLNVEYQSDRYRNVIATLPGRETTSDEVIIVGAHYDSISPDPADSPGATDNACGVATVLELARVMSTYQFNHTIEFAFWNAEEESMQGSTDYVAHASSRSMNIPLYLNYDSLTYDPDNRHILDVMFNERSKPYAELMTRYNSLYAIGLNLTFNMHDCSSDHTSFWQGGYSAITTHSQAHPPQHHTKNDTIELVSSGFAVKSAQLGMLLLATKADLRPRNPGTMVRPGNAFRSPTSPTGTSMAGA